jgi:hypothetical protein
MTYLLSCLASFLQDIIENNSKHRLVQAQQESFRRDFMTNMPPLGLLLMQLCQNTTVLHLKNSLSSEMTHQSMNVCFYVIENPF